MLDVRHITLGVFLFINGCLRLANIKEKTLGMYVCLRAL
jgi:hypothetical protein